MMEQLGLHSWWAVVWAFSLSIYYPLTLAMSYGMLRLPRTRPLKDEDAFPVTVLVSARNEEKDIPRCIDSLIALDYPEDKLQIVLVNDFSTDATGAIIDEYAARYSNIVAVHSEKMPNNGLNAKARGIANGFTVATGDWVLISDADAKVHPQWIRHTLGQLEPETGMAGGALAIEKNGFISMFEKGAWAFVQIFNLGFAGLGMPFVCVGPNMAIKRSLYVAAGGLETSGSGIAEDLALLKMVVAGKQKIQTLFSPETTVSLTPVPTWTHLFSQQRRWLAGGLEFQEDYKFFLSLGFAWGLSAASFAAFGWLIFPKAWLLLMLGRLPLDFLWFLIQSRRMGQPHYLDSMPFILLYQPFAFIWIPISFMFSKSIRWMGEGYEIVFDRKKGTVSH
jgi:cellulose synthase/poly-beta-1,6-N-acetylglucosamine synthase-like glycosyltransferase